jgi:hypothetical protein
MSSILAHARWNRGHEKNYNHRERKIVNKAAIIKAATPKKSSKKINFRPLMISKRPPYFKAFCRRGQFNFLSAEDRR